MRRPWRDRLQKELITKTYRPSPVRRLQAKGLTLNDAKTRLVNLRQEGLNFLGFNLIWRQSWQGRSYLHIEPNQKSRRHRREKRGGLLNPWTRGRSIQDVLAEANRILRAWPRYFHYGNSVTMMKRLKQDTQKRLRRWLWRKQACRRSLWTHYATQQLPQKYGLYELPTMALWRVAR